MEIFCFKRGFRAKNGGEGRSEGAQRREIRPSADAMRGVADYKLSLAVLQEAIRSLRMFPKIG